jgi:hypothetical protein
MILRINPRLVTALKIADLGFKLSRRLPGTKTPFEKDWPNRASKNPDDIKYWFLTRSNWNLAIVTESIVVVDIDKKGLNSFSKQEYESLFAGDDSGPTPKQLTPNGGIHLFFRAPYREQPWKSLVGIIRPGIDIKTGPRSAIMCEPSFLADEETGQIIGYWKFEVPLREIQNLPDIPGWLHEEIERHQEPPRWIVDDEVVGEDNSDKPCMYYFEQGQRNEGMTRLAGKLRYYYQIRDEELLAQLLLVFNAFVCDPPLSKEEVRTIAKSLSQRPLTLRPKLKPEYQGPHIRRPSPRRRRPWRCNQLPNREFEDKIAEAMYKKYKQAFEQK